MKPMTIDEEAEALRDVYRNERREEGEQTYLSIELWKKEALAARDRQAMKDEGRFARRVKVLEARLNWMIEIATGAHDNKVTL